LRDGDHSTAESLTKHSRRSNARKHLGSGETEVVIGRPGDLNLVSFHEAEARCIYVRELCAAKAIQHFPYLLVMMLVDVENA
jgi:hypothetical protein